MGGTQQVLKGILLDLWVHANVRGRQLVWVVASTQLSTNKRINCLLSVQPCHWWGPAYQTQLQIHKCIYKYTNTQKHQLSMQLYHWWNSALSSASATSVSTDMLQPKCSEETHEKEQKRKDKQLCSPATGRAVHTKHILSASIGGVMIKLEEA